MKHRLVFIGFLFALTLTGLHCGKDKEDPVTPDPPPPGMVMGKVSNEYGQPLNGALVSIQGNAVNKKLVVADGEYQFNSLAEGAYNVVVKKEGYIETAQSISIARGDTLVKDMVLKAGSAFFYYLSDTVLVAHGFAATYKLQVSSNTGWVVNSANDWIVPAKPGYQGTDSAIIRIAASPLDTERQGMITLQAGSMTKQIVVKQVPEIRLLGSRPLPGNQVHAIRDSIELQFNAPVKITRLFPALSTCQSDMGITYKDNKAVFSYACAALGGDYSFTVVTTNSMGDQYTFTTNVGFYNKVQLIKGHIRLHYVNEEDHAYWIATSHPNALYKVDMHSFEVLKRIDLPNTDDREPLLLTINPYNNKIYVAFRYVPKLYILNQDGKLEKEMTISGDPARPSYQRYGLYTYPYNLVFTKSGKGMIWLGDNMSSSPIHWFIDAADDHRIWYEALPGEAAYYSGGQHNQDKTKILLSQTYESSIGTFDPALKVFSGYKPVNAQQPQYFTINRTNTDIFFCQQYQQLIVNPDTKEESRTMNFAGFNSYNGVDFTYLPGREKSVYFAGEAKISMVDFATGTIPVTYDALYYTTGTTATTDGRYLILYRNDGNYNGRLFQLPVSWFTRTW